MTMFVDSIAFAKQFERVDGMTAVVVIYRRPIIWSDHMLELVCGQFTHCELYIPSLNGTFITTTDFGCQFRTDVSSLYTQQQQDYAWHMIPMTKNEFQRFWTWNVEQVEQHCKYNYRDLLWQLVPNRKTFVKDLANNDAHHPPRMFCSQAVVLALRAAFDSTDSTSRMREFSTCMNSRITTPCSFLSTACAYLGNHVTTKRVPMNPIEVNSALQNALSSLQTSNRICRS
jgi:hypothetical protein